MAKTTTELRTLVDAFVTALSDQLVVERVILWGDYATGAPSSDSDVRLVVISPSFEGRERTSRMADLALIALRIDPLIQAWGYTPAELTGAHEGPLYSPLLSMILQESLEVYPAPFRSLRRMAQRNA